MTDWQLMAVVLGSVTTGAFIYAIAQVAGAIASLSREVRSASREIGEVAVLLKPVARRLDRLSALALQSEPDLQKIQLSMRQIASGSHELSENFARVSGWVGMAAPIVAAVVESWAGHRPGGFGGEASPATEGPAPRPETAPTAANANPLREASAQHPPVNAPKASA